jgi:erythromycin esterase-like protein
MSHSADIISMIAAHAAPIHAESLRAEPLDASASLDPFVERLSEARFVLLGEATHGTREFYRIRAQLTRRLLDECGFSALLVEADWPDAYRANRYVQLLSDEPDANEALGDFERFPKWMWRNEEVVELIEWMRRRNADHPAHDRAGFYGFDLYSLHRSMSAVIDFLRDVAPDAAERARERYSCFDHFGPDPQSYGYAAMTGDDCEDEVVAQLVDLEQNRARVLADDGMLAEDEFFFAEQNARVAQNAEQYYRTMFQGHASSWNLRDRHMARTAGALSEHLANHDRSPRIVIWAHNSHLGDARATSMGRRGELNVGQLLRQSYGDEVTNVGFLTYDGTVTAASNWGEHAEYKRVRPALEDSIEALLHQTGLPAFVLDTRADDALAEALAHPRLQRAIGVIYRPETERASHYFHAGVSEQFDWIVHVDATRALAPLDPATLWLDAARDDPDLAETFPFGI